MESRVLTAKEKAICEQNLNNLAAVHKFTNKRCSYCDYPLSGLIENNFSTETNGSVCELCHQMEFALRGKKKLEAAHLAWKDDQKRKKRILEKDGNKYFE